MTSVAPDTRVLATYVGTAAADWELDGVPAITSHPHGQGAAIYVGCDLGRHDITHLLKELNTTAPSDERPPTKGRVGEINAATTTAAATTHDPRILHTIRQSSDGTIRFGFLFRTVRSSPLPSTVWKVIPSSPTVARLTPLDIR